MSALDNLLKLLRERSELIGKKPGNIVDKWIDEAAAEYQALQAGIKILEIDLSYQEETVLPRLRTENDDLRVAFIKLGRMMKTKEFPAEAGILIMDMCKMIAKG